MYKLVAIDIDGTLIGSDFELSERTKQTVKAVAQKGVHIVLTSGRIFGSARFYARQLGLTSVILSCNGAVAKNATDRKLVFSDPIDPETCKMIFRQLEKDGTFFQFYGEEVFYAPRMEHEALYFRDWVMGLPEEDKIPIEAVTDPYGIPEKDGVCKIYIRSEGKNRDYHKKLFGDRDDLTLTSSWDTNFEINGAGVNKGSGVMRYARMLGISQQEVLCIGDGLNDEEMIRIAGLGVAMGNGKDEIKRIADFITDTNDNDGVAKALEKFVL